MIVRYGTNIRTSSQYPDLSVSKIIQNEDYDSNTIQNDISLLVLSSAITPSDNAKVISIKDKSPVDGDKVKVYGWGLTDGSNSNSLATNLQVGTMTIVSQEKCNEKWGSVNAIVDGMVCALDASQSACNVSFDRFQNTPILYCF